MWDPLPTEVIVGYRQCGGPRLSPDGAAIAWLEGYRGRTDILVQAMDGSPAVTVTTEPTTATNVSHAGGCFAWTPDSHRIVFAARSGDLCTVDRTGGPTQVLVADAGAGSPRCGGGLVAFVRTTATTQDIGVVDLDATTWPERLSRGADFCFDPDVAPDGTVAWHEWDVPQMPWDGGRIVLSRSGNGKPIVIDGDEDVSFGEPRFSPDAHRLAYLSDRNGWRNLWVCDLATGERRVAVADDADCGLPAWGPGAASYAWSPDGTQIAYLPSRDAATALAILDVGTGEVRTVDDPAGTYSHVTWAGSFICALYSDLGTPPEIRLIDPVSGARSVYSRVGVGGLPPLGETKHITWRGDDQHDVHGILVRPSGVSGPTPLLVWPHGGPTDQSRFAFNPRLHWFTSRGWSVLFVNYRGSTGYGRAYTQALHGWWGEADPDDVAAGVRHLLRAGLAQAGRVAIMGGSAGGYVVLQSLIRHGDLYAAGIDLYGVADLARLAETTWRFEAHYTDRLVGPLPESADVYADRSPVHNADRITVPLLILQGGRDESVPPEQSAAIAAAAREAGAIVEHHVYPDEGHGWSDPLVVADELRRIDVFLRRHVLGRPLP
ncbi:MAG: prolyl oligopeptidase family serine peptidase [Acidimicrobiia bacterium]|nr:prolyl oligopeptidase family serine peptidase [Acidimicrobiia bacterium]